MAYAIAVLVGYLAGCSNMAYYIARLREVDLRSGGSGNLGPPTPRCCWAGRRGFW